MRGYTRKVKKKAEQIGTEEKRKTKWQRKEHKKKGNMGIKEETGEENI